MIGGAKIQLFCCFLGTVTVFGRLGAMLTPYVAQIVLGKSAQSAISIYLVTGKDKLFIKL